MSRYKNVPTETHLQPIQPQSWLFNKIPFPVHDISTRTGTQTSFGLKLENIPTNLVLKIGTGKFNLNIVTSTGAGSHDDISLKKIHGFFLGQKKKALRNPMFSMLSSVPETT